LLHYSKYIKSYKTSPPQYTHACLFYPSETEAENIPSDLRERRNVFTLKLYKESPREPSTRAGRKDFDNRTLDYEREDEGLRHVKPSLRKYN
jgi:hypothetical protein